MKRDGTRWRTGGEVKWKLANGVGSQYPSHYLGTWCISITTADAHTSAASSRLNWRSRWFKWTHFMFKWSCIVIIFQPDSPRQRPHNLHETYQLPCAQLITPDDGHRRLAKHVEFRDKIKLWMLGASCWLFVQRFNGLVRLANRRSTISALVPSHFKRSLQSTQLILQLNAQIYYS
jgi:hypothetical protein